MPHGTPAHLQFASSRKAWWRSRTLWLNLLMMLLALAETNFRVLQPMLPVNVFAVIAFVLPIANAALRLVTNSALQWHAEQPLQPATADPAFAPTEPSAPQ